MQKLILALNVIFVLVTSSSFAATTNCIMYSVENDGVGGGLEPFITSTPGGNAINPQFEPPPPDEAGVVGPAVTSDFYFTIETDDDTGEVIAFTDLFGSNFLAYEYGGWNTEDSEPFDADEQIYKNGVTYSMNDVAFDGVTTGGDVHGIWFRGQSGYDLYQNWVWDVGIIDINFNGADGAVLLGPGPGPEMTESYVFHAVPVPASIWLLLSGLVGMIGFRKKFKKKS